MKLADKGLNMQAFAIEEMQTKIRIAIKNGYLAHKSKAQINAEVQRIIRDGLKAVTNVDLKDAAIRSLNAFAERQYNTYLRSFGASAVFILALAAVMNNAPDTREFAVAAKALERNPPPAFFSTEARGVPLQRYARDYFRKKLVPAFDKIMRQKALDPDDISGSNSLRNRAEMEVRYEQHLDDIEQLQNNGVKLVTTTVHADCSDRCYKWQGRVYSLDGTRGATDDGKQYVPLETATDVYYTTKAGKTYKNGLLGFNCRHKIIPYQSGMVIPHVSKEQQQRERAINTKQREMERIVRDQREKALIFKNIDHEAYLAARKRAIEAYKAYKNFSHDNGRAYYPSRVQLL